MSDINVDKIFNLFDAPKVDTIEDFKKHPIYFILMFKKILNNYSQFKSINIKSIKKLHPELDEEDLEKANQYISFTKAYQYIQKLDLTNDKHMFSLVHQKDDVLVTNLNMALDYFVSVENYENCAFIRDVLNKLDTNGNVS